MRILHKVFNMFGSTLLTNRKLIKINKKRLSALKDHLSSGGTCFVELGCGDGNFAADLSKKTNTWVLGIDRTPINKPQSKFDRNKKIMGVNCFDPVKYLEIEKFAFLKTDYSTLTGIMKTKFQWLMNKAQKTFMTMPYPSDNYRDERDIWFLLAEQKGELHIQSNNNDIIYLMNISRPYKQINYCKEAVNIDSFYTQYCFFYNSELFSYGIKLIR